MIADNYVRAATIRRVIDGDTIEVMIDDGRRRYSVERIRLLRINAPEIEGVTKEAGIASRNYLSTILPVGTVIAVQTFKDKKSFDRWLGEAWFIDASGNQINISDHMVSVGMAVPFMV